MKAEVAAATFLLPGASVWASMGEETPLDEGHIIHHPGVRLWKSALEIIQILNTKTGSYAKAKHLEIAFMRVEMLVPLIVIFQDALN